jgi:hypothetical protein
MIYRDIVQTANEAQQRKAIATVKVRVFEGFCHRLQ